MKKIITFLLLITMLASVMVGCRDTDKNGSETSGSDTSNNTENTTAEGTVGVPEFSVSPGTDGEMFVDQSEKKRSSHLGHALIEYESNKILAFYSNTEGWINSGHNCRGWVEYKRSEDGGETWSEPVILEYSKQLHDSKEALIACEKAILTKDGKIILFCYKSVYDTKSYGPAMIPTYLTSDDGGVTWSEAKDLGIYEGRIWDAVERDGEIFVLMQREYNSIAYHTGDPAHVLYKSVDGGETFKKCGNVTFAKGGVLFYGNLIVTSEGKLRVYVYQHGDEFNLLCYESKDGRAFKEIGASYCAKRIRNPQVIELNGIYFLHGRSGDNGESSDFVLYTSQDGLTWDEGQVIGITQGWGGCSYYSNSIVVGGKRILIQASDAYNEGRTNVKHWWIDFKES